ncbi:hypothetical protein E0H26_08800 [Micromonospora zingiberis]|uniref:Uncharacterized protein n=1 Tax=Micromonospora zingiberis TaxID=2053011 RepID=A0A4R0GNI2_9ACTN|nr:hypothetical protein [Micromonospora zingiberis]TCB98467.1 hypothetical protein E0H26_08800 [Micromonospora zingiberis]
MTRRESCRRAVTATGLVALLALAACTGGTGPPAEGPVPPGAAAVPPGAAVGPDAFPGLYVTGDVVPVSASASQVTLASGRSCPELSAMLAAGQWRTVDRLSFGKLGEREVALLAGFGGIPGDLLSRGDRLVFAGLTGGSACTATVSETATGEITVAGAGLPGRSPGWVATTRCYRSKSDGTLTVSFYFDTDGKVGGQGQIALTRDADRYAVADDASASTLTLLRHDSRFLGAMSAAYADPRRRPAGLRQLVPGDAFTGTAEVRDGSAGVIGLAGLEAEDGGRGAIEVSLPFSCPAVIEIR